MNQASKQALFRRLFATKHCSLCLRCLPCLRSLLAPVCRALSVIALFTNLASSLVSFIFLSLSSFSFLPSTTPPHRLTESLKDLVTSNGRLPRRVADAHRAEMREAALRCAAMREVCFGADSPISKQAQGLVRLVSRV